MKEAGRRKVFLTLLLAVALTACNQTRFAYEHLDWYARWRAHDYVSFKPDQSTAFKREFVQLWRWHRQEELPLYANDLREIASALDRPVTASQVHTYLKRTKLHGEQTVLHTTTGLCPVLRSLDDAQVKDILKAVDRNDREFSQKFVEMSDDRLRRNSETKAREWVAHWTGPLNEAQKDLVHQWSLSRLNTGSETLEYRRQWRAKLKLALDERQSSPECKRFGPLFVSLARVDDKVLAAKREHNEVLWSDLLVNVIGAMDDGQREHARKELRKLAADFDSLAKANTAESSVNPSGATPG